MESVHTVRIRQDWIDAAIDREGGMSELARRLGIATSTISRQANGQAEAGPRFIGAVLSEFAVSFQEAFDVVEERVRVRRARYVKQIRSAA